MADPTSKDAENSMQMDESTLLDNKDADLENQQEEERDSRSFMAPPTPTPMRRSPRPEPTPQQKAAQEKLQQMQRQIYQQQAMRQQWRNPSRDMKRIQKTLASDPAIRGALMQLYGPNPGAFLTLPPRQQLQVVRNVANHLKQIAQKITNPQANSQVDLSVPINMQRALENGDSVVSQNAAMQVGAVKSGNEEVAEEIRVEAEQQAQEKSPEGLLVAAGAGAAFTLTNSDVEGIEKHRQMHSTPTPQPSGSSADKKDHTEAGTVMKHETEEIAAKDLAKNARAEKHALDAVIDNDKAAFKDAAKGVEKVVESGLEHAAGGVLSMIGSL